jgi:NAD+ synthase
MDTNCFSEDWLRIDPERESARIEEYLRQILARDLKRRGLVIGLSGGVDSTVTAALAARAGIAHAGTAVRTGNATAQPAGG